MHACMHTYIHTYIHTSIHTYIQNQHVYILFKKKRNAKPTWHWKKRRRRKKEKKSITIELLLESQRKWIKWSNGDAKALENSLIRIQVAVVLKHTNATLRGVTCRTLRVWGIKVNISSNSNRPHNDIVNNGTIPRLTSAQRNNAIGRLQAGRVIERRPGTWRVQTDHLWFMDTVQHHLKC